MTDFYQKMGTAITWKNAGGDYAITLADLASGSARNGVKGDLGANFGLEYGFKFTTQWDAGEAPTDGTLVRLFFAYSEDDSTFSGAHGGADAAGVVDSLRNMQEVKPLVCDNVTTTQVVIGTFRPAARYIAPTVYNDATAQALSATAGNHELVIWPLVPTG